MKSILLSLAILIVGVNSSHAFAKEVPKRQVVVISFSENETRSRAPSSIDERAVMAAQARHIASTRSLDQAIEDLD
jgi:hypothetical protein